MKYFLYIALFFCSCQYQEVQFPTNVNGYVQNMYPQDVYMPTIISTNPSDTILQVDSAIFTKVVDLVNIDLTFDLATCAGNCITSINNLWVDVPIPVGYKGPDQAWINDWSAYQLQGQTAEYDIVEVRAHPGDSGYMRLEVKLERYGLVFIPQGEHIFHFEVNATYRL